MAWFSLAILVATIIVVSAGPVEFEEWKKEFNKNFKHPAEEAFRQSMFERNLVTANNYNAKVGPNGLKMKLNENADRHPNELAKTPGSVRTLPYKLVPPEPLQRGADKPVGLRNKGPIVIRIPSVNRQQGVKKPVSVPTEPVKHMLGAPLKKINDSEFESFKKKYGKAYKDDVEEGMRYERHQKAKTMVDKHNADPSATYKMKLNEYADLTENEMSKMLGGKLPPNEATFLTSQVDAIAPPGTSNLLGATSVLPTSVDYRSLLGPCENQGSYCGSCWAHSAKSAMECVRRLKMPLATASTPNFLSQQNILDCSDTSYGNYGCDGGWYTGAFKYAADVSGLNKMVNYPYDSVSTGVAGSCRYNVSDKNVPLGAPYGYALVTANSDSAMVAALANYGCVSVAFNVQNSLYYYSSGIYKPYAYEKCYPSGVNHAVVIVGYTSTYWIIRNSWGTGWGENGHFRVARSSGNICGILGYGAVPKLPTTSV